LEINSPNEITRLLLDWNEGDKAALDRLMPLVCDELRRLAASYMGKERTDHTLQSTALVNEAYLRLVEQSSISWQNRAHFFGIAARMMRQILVNHAEAYNAAKRGGSAPKLSLDDAVSFVEQRELDLVALDDALKELEKLDALKSRIVELRFFGGLTIEETAVVLAISHDTVERHWKMAKLWLRRELIGIEPTEND
jgi:RNA polymerase sigma factor (TIGR02999 family)